MLSASLERSESLCPSRALLLEERKGRENLISTNETEYMGVRSWKGVLGPLMGLALGPRQAKPKHL